MSGQTTPTDAELVRRARNRRALSQSELAELAGVSTKTIQRLEAGASAANSSRRVVFEALGIDLDEVTCADPIAVPPVRETDWTEVEDARGLWQQLASARAIDVEVDREGWRRALRERPWYKQGIIIATSDPVDEILRIVDEIPRSSELPPGQLARRQGDLAAAIHGAGKLEWSLAFRVDRSGLLSLFLGPPAAVSARV